MSRGSPLRREVRGVARVVLVAQSTSPARRLHPARQHCRGKRLSHHLRWLAQMASALEELVARIKERANPDAYCVLCVAASRTRD